MLLLLLCSFASTPAPTPLGNVLQDAGFLPIPLTKMTTGHLVVQISLDQTGPKRFVVDTGAGHSVVANRLVPLLPGTQSATTQVVGGIGGTGLLAKTVEVSNLRVGPHPFGKHLFHTMDLQPLNQQFESAGESPVFGILGHPWMKAHGVLIDVGNAVMYVRKP